MQTNRLNQGGFIDRNKTLRFTFNGQSYSGYQGDTLASALIANGIKIVGRSFKYHRPRGIIGSGAEEPNAIFQIGSGATTEAGMRATQIELYDGLVAKSEKGWPSLSFDIAIINDWFSKLFGAGFYYKTFMYPAKFWKIYEYFLRRMAGLGQAPKQPDPDHYSHQNIHCDILIVGAGPAGLMAAVSAGKSGAKVVIADDQAMFGGSLLASKEIIDGQSSEEWIASQVECLKALPNVTCLSRSTVFGYYDYNFLTINERCTNHLSEFTAGQIRQKLWRVRAKRVVLAQGAFERPLVFPNNDRPGIMLASAVSNYIHRYGVIPGKNAVLFTNNDSAYQAAIDLKMAGAQSVFIVDSRSELPSDMVDAAKKCGVELQFDAVIRNAIGNKSIKAVEISTYDANDNTCKDIADKRECDLLIYSGGWSPAVHLHSQSGGKNKWDEERHCFVPDKPSQASSSIGSCNGTWILEDCLKEGINCGQEMVTNLGFQAADINLPNSKKIKISPMKPLWQVIAKDSPEHLPKQFVDYQNDTTVSDIYLAVREGYTGIEHVKRYTALGFGTDQGKLGNINGMAILGQALEKPIAQIGTTTFRPAYTPVTFGVVAGEDIDGMFEPTRKTAMHNFHTDRKAPLEIVGQWVRPWYFPRDNEDMLSAVSRECMAARSSLGIMDASTLGKIDVCGKDAVSFLEKIYTHDVAKMSIGQCAYGVMLGEDGMIKDDGVMARLGENHFYLTTTTGGAANVMSWLEQWLQTEWPHLDVYMTSLTDHLSTIALVGPNSRRVLQTLVNTDLSAELFPFMRTCKSEIAGIAIDLYRVSFSGELAFEINVNSNFALHLWNLLMKAGKDFGLLHMALKPCMY
ncbi:MAG: 2Fe-2S iron-sulfur cluster-binding protein [Woeseiaceae bacterium]